MLWGGRWEGGSCLGTHVRIKDFKILKIKNKKKFKKIKTSTIVKKKIKIKKIKPGMTKTLELTRLIFLSLDRMVT